MSIALVFLSPFLWQRGVRCAVHTNSRALATFTRPPPRHAADAVKSRSGSQSRIRKPDEGTMTLREKELFSNIFKSLLQKQSSTRTDDEGTLQFTHKKEPPLEGREIGSTSPSTGNLPSTLARDYLEAYPPSVREQAVQAEASLREAQARDAARQEAIEGRKSEMYEDLRVKLLACGTTSEIQEFLEVHLFGPFADRKISLSKMSQKNTSDESVFCRAYPILLAETMSVLRLSYRDYFAATAVFRRIKDLGPESEVVGVNIATYNELLLATFEGWHDIDLVLDILNTMSADGITADYHTYLILKKIASSVVAERASTEGGRAFWALPKPRKLEVLSRKIHLLDPRSATRTANSSYL